MPHNIIDRLPPARGTITTQVPMAQHTWFGVGGIAQAMFSPLDTQDLAQFLKNLPQDIPVYPLGAGSNLLVRDGGLHGVVINLTHHMKNITQDKNLITANQITVGAGLLDAEVARWAAKNSRAGLEFLIGIPGTIGGGLRMNAGAYGTEFKDIVINAEAVARNGHIHTATPIEMGMGYRHTTAPQDWIFTQATLKTTPGAKDAIRAKMKDIVGSRADAQPRGVRTGGSTFANPQGHKAWQLIEAAGLRGHQIGGASVSDKHCNFLINNGKATADDIETLGETIRKTVKETSGIDLRWEIRRIGSQPESIKNEGGTHD